MPNVGVGVDAGDANGMGDMGVGSMRAGGVGGVGVDGRLFARVTSGLPWTWEVTVPRASGVAFRSNGHPSLSRDSGHVPVDAGKAPSCRRVGCR